jgi:hypothetical protein
VSRPLLTLLCILGLATGGLVTSGADFTAHSASTGSFTAAADFNTVTVSLSNPGGTLTNSVNLAATAASDRGVASVKFEQSPANTGDWVQICVDATPSYGCAWNTVLVADGLYDLRATATDTAGYTKTSVVEDRNVDNHNLTATLADPGAMSGTKTLTATASGAESGLTWLRIQHRATGETAWTTLCSGTPSPRTCDLDTTSLASGGRELRAAARDGAGHEVVSATITRTIDNTPPQTTAPIPPSGSGPVQFEAVATDDGSGIKYVAWEARFNGQWYEFCRDSTAPYTCSGDSAQVEDGTYDVRVITENNAGVKTTSATQQIVIDNTPPQGTEVRAYNGGSTVGRLEADDYIRLTWSQQIKPSSVLAGWDGTSTAVKVRITDNPGNDRMDFLSVGGTRLNLVMNQNELRLNANFVSAETQFSATMTQNGGAITITLGAFDHGALQTAASGTMTWRPSSAATDMAGNASQTTQVNESGSLDTDF